MKKIFSNNKYKGLGIAKIFKNALNMILCTIILVNVSLSVKAQCTTTNMTTTAGASVTNSGTAGICLGCSVTNTANVTNTSTTDFATISIPVGLVGTGFIEVTLPQTYPAGTRIGFVVDVNGGVAGLLGGTTLIAYNGSTQVGTASAGSLINVLGIGGGTNVNAVFCQPFNKVRIQMGSLAGLLATYKVYYAYVNESCSFPVQCNLATASTEICGDNIDNDGDGLIDSEDTCIIPCNAGTSAPILTATTKVNGCPTTTVDLTTITATNLPSGGTTLTWHTGTPATTANKVTGTAVAAGTYYAAFFDAANNCYAGTTAGSATTVVTATSTACVSPGGSVANVCPATTINLTLHTQGTIPVGTTVTWHTGTPATSANKVANPTTAGAGTYYAAFEDATNNCYSPTMGPVTATSNACGVPVAGTIDCSKTQIFTAPVFGTAGQKTLVVTINVTSPGCFTPITVSGSGMTLANGSTQVCTTTTGVQTFSIPVNYDGTTLGTMNFTVGTAGNAGTCSADLTKTPKKAISDVWTLDCVPTEGPILK